MTKGHESDRLHLAHILECIENVNQDVQADRERLLSNRTIRDAVLRNLQVLAESTQRLSDEIKSSQPHVPWFNSGRMWNAETQRRRGKSEVN